MNLYFRLFLLMVALLSACGPARAQGPVVAGVDFAGCVNVKEDTCRAAVKLKQGEAFSAERLEADRKALLGLGYFRSVAASQATTDGKTQVSFRLVEWPTVLYVRILGNAVVDRPAIREVITTKAGQVLCAPQLQDDIRAIERLYRDRGYVVRVSEKLLDEATSSGILRFELLETKIGEVAFEGGTPKLQERAREALQELPPALYRPEEVTLDQQRLLKVRGIQHAIPRVSITAPGQVRILWMLNPPADKETGKLGN